MKLAVYVPREHTELREEIWSGSGIVGSEVGETGRLRLDFEGDEEVFPDFESRVRRAAERHVWEGPDGQGYPTRACAYCSRDEVVQVGVYDTERNELTVTTRAALAAWTDDG